MTNAIKITRGDSATFRVEITSSVDGGEYTPGDDDVLRLTVKKTMTDQVALIQKEAKGGDPLFKFVPADTSGLAFGSYVYDVELTTGDGDVYTVIKPSLFEVLGEVTW